MEDIGPQDITGYYSMLDETQILMNIGQIRHPSHVFPCVVTAGNPGASYAANSSDPRSLIRSGSLGMISEWGE